MRASDWKLGLSTCASDSVAEEVFAAYADAGIAVMEVSLPWEVYPSVRWKALQALSARYGVEVRSVHLPFLPFEINDLSSLDASVRANTVSAHAELLARASDAGIRVAVVHPSAEPIPASERAERLKYTQESLALLAERAAACGAVVAVEDLPRTCIGSTLAEMEFLLEADGRLRLCFDTNHLLGGADRNPAYIRALGHKFVTLHVSDYDFVDERHLLPGEGRNDWSAIVSLLEDAGYGGPFLYEVRRTPQAGRRALRYDDYRRNYDAVVNKLPIPRVV